MLGLIILNMVLICMAYRFASLPCFNLPLPPCPWCLALGALLLLPCPALTRLCALP